MKISCLLWCSTFDVRDNKVMLEKNKRYRTLTANSATAQSSYSNNWNYSLEDAEVEEEHYHE